MKLLSVLICIILYASSVSANGIRVKRGVSAEEQKFVDELNKDRKKIADDLGDQYVPLTYDDNLSEQIDPSPTDCLTSLRAWTVPLKGNKVAEDYKEYCKKNLKIDIHYPYFYSLYSKIGCSKTFKCSEMLTTDNKMGFDAPKSFNGRTIEYYGICYLQADHPESSLVMLDKLKEAELPSPSKYGDILGVAAPPEPKGGATDGKELNKAGSGRVFPIILSLSLVFFFWCI